MERRAGVEREDQVQQHQSSSQRPLRHLISQSKHRERGGELGEVAQQTDHAAVAKDHRLQVRWLLLQESTLGVVPDN